MFVLDLSTKIVSNVWMSGQIHFQQGPSHCKKSGSMHTYPRMRIIMRTARSYGRNLCPRARSWPTTGFTISVGHAVERRPKGQRKETLKPLHEENNIRSTALK
jgi:hypothetical protein